MLTAALRDLHLCYPNRYITDVRTPYPELWDNNPYLSDLSEDDPTVEVINCEYPLIKQSNSRPFHFLHGFTEFLNNYLQLQIKPTLFKGDIHLSESERLLPNPIRKYVNTDLDYWLINAGGKYDFTAKWWAVERYQQVVDHFTHRIQFVQIGAKSDYHPLLQNVIDLRGKTNLRELVYFVYHAQGILTPVSLPMHLSAAVPTKAGMPKERPCVVIAGGREPPQWEAYPQHQFIHTSGSLKCCETGGCWKARAYPLGDGDEKDRTENLCGNLVGRFPRCMALITAEDVIRRIEYYYQGRQLRYLHHANIVRAQTIEKRKESDPYEIGIHELTVNNARTKAEEFITQIPQYEDTFLGKGIVICGGGVTYFTCAWVCINMLRRMGCKLPIQLWYLGPLEMDAKMKQLVKPFGVTCIDARAHWKRQQQFNQRNTFELYSLGGWQLKAYSILHSSLKEILLLDADNVPVVNPKFLFETPEYKECGAVFWPDYSHFGPEREIWDICGVTYRDEPEFESGQLLVDKSRCWNALQLAMWYNKHANFYYQYIHGDKDTFHLAFRKLEQAYAMTSYPIHPLEYTMCQHDFDGRRIFQHRNLAKWTLNRPNLRLFDFWYEEECLEFLQYLKIKWNGQINNDELLEVYVQNGALKHIALKLSDRVYNYHRVGYDSRFMSFRKNGLIGQGHANNEVYWDLLFYHKIPMLEISGNQGTTCLLQLGQDSVWKGRWLKYEKMPVELIPVSA